jgi:hypothetical protein
VAMPLIFLFLHIFILSFIVFLQSGYAANFSIPLHVNFIIYCIPTKWLCR